MQYPASTTICGTPGARKSARPYLEICTGTSRINGPHWQTNPYSVRRNGSLPSCRRIIRSILLSVRLRFMTAELSEKSRMMKTFMYVNYAVPRKWSVLHGSMPIQMNNISDSDDSEWYSECEVHNPLLTQKEFKEQMQSWWNSCEFKVMEQITGLRKCEYPSEDSSLAFVDAAGQWWDKQDY